jgi:hypothetical protein
VRSAAKRDCHPGLEPGPAFPFGACEGRQAPDQVRGDGEIVKPINVWPMAIMLIFIVLLVIYLRPH